MPDITAQILPTEFLEGTIADRFFQTAEELDYRYPNDPGQAEWCLVNIKQSLMDWVSAGLIAQWTTRYRIWEQKFSSWRNFCLHGLGRDPWKIKKLIEHSQIVVELAKEGFTTLPANQSQVEKLSSCAKKLGCLITEAWDKVVESLPERLITADNIAQSLGFAATTSRISLPKPLRDRLEQEAYERGLSLREMLEIDYGIKSEENPTQDETAEEVSEVEPEAIEAWEADLEELVTEHDSEIWLLATLTKLASLVNRQTSQFSWLRQFRYRTS